MKVVKIFTDGACRGNPGLGGYGIILIYHANRKEVYKSYRKTTNNRMELMSVIEALSLLKESCHVVVTTDSQYVVNAINKGWLQGWIKNDWKKSSGERVLNRDLWERLVPLLKRHAVNFAWIKGHGGHPENERCDGLANLAMDKIDPLIDVIYEGV